MGALSNKTVLLVTHQVDFLPVFDSILVSILIFSHGFYLTANQMHRPIEVGSSLCATRAFNIYVV